MLKKNIIYSLVQYLLIILVIQLSGGVLIYSFGFEKVNILLFIIMLCVNIINYKRYKFNYIMFLSLLLISTLGLLNIVVHNFQAFSGNFGIIIRFFIAFFIVNIIRFKELLEKYVNVMLFLSVASLIFYFIGVINLNFIEKLPIIYDSIGMEFRNAFIHVYLRGVLGRFRNCGIFGEPGVYQAFLNIALLIVVLNKENKKKSLHIIIFLVTIATTFSTTGFIISFIILMNYIIKFKNKNKYIYIFVFSVFILANPTFNKVVFSKFASNNISTNQRKVGTKVEMSLFYDYPIFGIGYERYKDEFEYRRIQLGMGNAVPTNSFAHTLVIYGFIYSLVMFFMFFSFCYTFSKKRHGKIIVTIVFILIFIPQELIFKQLFLTFALYGTQNFRIKKEGKS